VSNTNAGGRAFIACPAFARDTSLARNWIAPREHYLVAVAAAQVVVAMTVTVKHKRHQAATNQQ
jgi:hypothetical protein